MVYQSLLRGEIVPGMSNHLRELPFPAWIQTLELVMLLLEKKVVTTPVRFRVVRVPPSLAPPCSSPTVEVTATVRHQRC